MTGIVPWPFQIACLAGSQHPMHSRLPCLPAWMSPVASYLGRAGHGKHCLWLALYLGHFPDRSLVLPFFQIKPSKTNSCRCRSHHEHHDVSMQSGAGRCCRLLFPQASCVPGHAWAASIGAAISKALRAPKQCLAQSVRRHTSAGPARLMPWAGACKAAAWSIVSAGSA